MSCILCSQLPIQSLYPLNVSLIELVLMSCLHLCRSKSNSISSQLTQFRMLPLSCPYNEQFRITSFVLTTIRTASIVFLEYDAQPYSYIMNRLSYILELDHCLCLCIMFKFTQDSLGILIYWIQYYNTQFHFIKQNIILNRKLSILGINYNIFTNKIITNKSMIKH